MPDIFISDPIPSEVPPTEAQRIKIPGHTHNKFSSFCLYPEGVDFETREKEESIILLLRAHPITNVKWIFITVLMLFAPGVFGVFGLMSTLPLGFGLVLTLSWYLITSAYALEGFLNWYFNIYIVTTKRVVDVDFYNLIYKEVSDANLNKVQDVTYNMGGVVRTLFNYGNVYIQTASEVPNFDFLAVPSPDKVVKVIQDMTSKLEDHK
jgi:hypothetical protein